MIVLNKEETFVSDYVVFDLETTGLDATSDRIIEIGALKYQNNELVLLLIATGSHSDLFMM